MATHRIKVRRKTHALLEADLWLEGGGGLLLLSYGFGTSLLGFLFLSWPPCPPRAHISLNQPRGLSVSSRPRHLYPTNRLPLTIIISGSSTGTHCLAVSRKGALHFVQGGWLIPKFKDSGRHGDIYIVSCPILANQVIFSEQLNVNISEMTFFPH